MIKDKEDCFKLLEQVVFYISENPSEFNHWKGCLNLARVARNKIQEDIENERNNIC
jgi:hypothetical protein